MSKSTILHRVEYQLPSCNNWKSKHSQYSSPYEALVVGKRLIEKGLRVQIISYEYKHLKTYIVEPHTTFGADDATY